MRIFRRLCVFILVVYIGLSCADRGDNLLGGEIHTSEVDAIVIVPDIHGDTESFQKALFVALVDVESFHGTYQQFIVHLARPNSQRVLGSPRTLLLQLGDVVDRGPDSLGCLRLLSRIESIFGWQVVRLFGNHELLSHVDDSNQYIHPADFRIFAEAFRDPNARANQFSRGGALWNHIVENSVVFARFSEGESSTGPLLPVSSSSTLFVHGGMELHWVDRWSASPNDPVDVVGFNELARKSMLTDAEPSFFYELLLRQSPLWVRDLAELDPTYVCDVLLPPILERFNVARIIVGHTPQWDLKMKSLCRSRLILADAAMSKWIQTGNSPRTAGNPTVLVMKQSQGELVSLEALYWQDSETASRDTFYDIDSGGVDFTKDGYSESDGAFALEDEASREAQWDRKHKSAIRVNSANTYLFLQEKVISNRAVAGIIGLPEVRVAEDPAWLGWTLWLDIAGESLGATKHATLTVVRQIFFLLQSLLAEGLTVAPSTEISMFVLDSQSGMVKLADVTKVQPAVSREDAIRFVDQMKNAFQPSPYEQIDFEKLTDEFLPQSEQSFASARESPAEMLRSWFSGVTSTSGGTDYTAAGRMRSVSGDSLWSAEESSGGESSNSGESYEDVWGIESSIVCVMGKISGLAEVKLASDSILDRETALVSAISPGSVESFKVYLSTVRYILDLQRPPEAIPRVLGHLVNEADNTIQIAFDVDPRLIVSMDEVINGDGEDLTQGSQYVLEDARENLIQAVEDLHAAGISLNIGFRDEPLKKMLVERVILSAFHFRKDGLAAILTDWTLVSIESSEEESEYKLASAIETIWRLFISDRDEYDMFEEVIEGFV